MNVIFFFRSFGNILLGIYKFLTLALFLVVIGFGVYRMFLQPGFQTLSGLIFMILIGMFYVPYLFLTGINNMQSKSHYPFKFNILGGLLWQLVLVFFVAYVSLFKSLAFAYWPLLSWSMIGLFVVVTDALRLWHFYRQHHS
ncbi:MAG: hypothetical protein ACK5UI_02540 [Bacteroidota bacterium]|jgi:hypothetical protein